MAFTIVRNNIAQMDVDAVVNSANPAATYGRGGDCGVFLAAGKELLLEERKKIGSLAPGEVAVTSGFDLPARFILHAVAPVYRTGSASEVKLLESCYEKSLRIAEENGWDSIAFPLLGAGNNGWPRKDALAAAMRRIRDFLSDHELSITLVVFDEDSAKAAEEYGDVRKCISRYQVEETLREEYDKREVIHERRLYSRPRRREEDEVSDFMKAPSIDTGSAPTAYENCISYAPTRKERDSEETMLRMRRAPLPRYAKDWQERLAGLSVTVREPFHVHLQSLIDKRGLTDPEVYRKANLSRQTFHKIINGTVVPKKNTLFVLMLVLRLNADEAMDLMALAGYAYSPSSLSDLLMRYCFENEIYDFIEVDDIFLSQGETPIIGSMAG